MNYLSIQAFLNGGKQTSVMGLLMVIWDLGPHHKWKWDQTSVDATPSHLELSYQPSFQHLSPCTVNRVPSVSEDYSPSHHLETPLQSRHSRTQEKRTTAIKQDRTIKYAWTK